jgi:hypothetical protein
VSPTKPLPRAAFAALLACCGCGKSAGGDGAATSAMVTPSGDLLEAAEEEGGESGDAGAQQHGVATRAGERVAIPAGKLVVGSTPGDRGRDPSLEPAGQEVELGAFEIDKLPHPNDPQKRPVTAVSRARAAELCAEAGGRLCTELEWERACKGPDMQTYAGGTRWDPACASRPETCSSAFGVLAMGAAQREWTASDVQPIKRLVARSAAVRGARGDAADVDHRCAHRTAVAPEATADDLGFRCCHGAAQGDPLPSPPWEEIVRKADMPPARLEELLGSNKRLAGLAKDIKYFREDAAIETVIKRGKARGSDAGAPAAELRMTTAPILWNPVAGEEIVLCTGRSGESSFIVALHRLPGDRYRVAAALVMENELGPVVLIYEPGVRAKLHWTTCWECYGETGNITYREDHRVVITQK